MKKEKLDFSQYIMVECSMVAWCATCGKEEVAMDSTDDTTDIETRLENDGWNIIDDNLYCKKCSKKELKRIKLNEKEFNKIVKRK